MNRTALLLAAALLCAALPALAADQRALDGVTAADEFRRTHNYAQSRGLSIVPGIGELLDLLGNAPLRPVHRRLIQDGFGLTLEDGRAIGLFTVEDEGMKVGAFGCVACHSGRAAGRTIIGMGNKGIDVATIGRSIGKFERPFRWLGKKRTPAQQAIVDRAFAFARKLYHPRIANNTKGLVSINHVNLWFYEQGGVDIPATVPRGGTKVPHLWGIAAKATKEGLFWDGLGKAGSIAWLALPELTAGQTAENIRKDFARIERLWDVIAKLEPPKYPFAIDLTAAERGKVVYAESCQKCHGTYERFPTGRPIPQPPVFNTLEEVGTDADRLLANTDQLKGLIGTSPLKDLVQAQVKPQGYYATRLEGTWADYPYMHNGSVPTLHDLLEKPERRPKAWSLDRPGEEDRFDKAKVGYTVPARGTIDRDKVETLGRRGARDIYHVDREGHSNKGHDFGTDLPEADKRALIEYLKTL
jgi:hypothetical protein